MTEEKTPRQPAVLMRDIQAIDEQLAKANKKAKQLKARKDELKRELWDSMEQNGNMEDFRVGDYRATKTATIVPGAVDWDVFGAFVIETNQLHLLGRKVSSAAFRELLEIDGNVPGVTPYEKHDISIRKVKRTG